MQKISDTKYFVFTNTNPKNKNTSDCVIRSISLATSQSWDETLDALVEISHRTKFMLNECRCYEKYLEETGWVKMRQPRKPDNRRYTGQEFCKYALELEHQGKVTTPILARIGSHHITVFIHDDVNQIRCYDTWDPTAGCIGNYWYMEN